MKTMIWVVWVSMVMSANATLLPSPSLPFQQARLVETDELGTSMGSDRRPLLGSRRIGDELAYFDWVEFIQDRCRNTRCGGHSNRIFFEITSASVDSCGVIFFRAEEIPLGKVPTEDRQLMVEDHQGDLCDSEDAYTGSPWRIQLVEGSRIRFFDGVPRKGISISPFN